jgi:hypothetical protein
VVLSSVVFSLPSLVLAHPAQQGAITTLQNKVKTLEGKVRKFEQQRPPPVPPATEGYRVVDSAGMIVGTATHACCDQTVPFVTTLNGHKVLLHAAREALVGMDWFLVYASLDCTGQPYSLRYTQLVPITVLATPGRTLYIPQGEPVQLLPQSLGYLVGSTDTWFCTTTADAEWPPEVLTVIPMVPLVDLNTLFVAPFHVE